MQIALLVSDLTGCGACIPLAVRSRLGAGSPGTGFPQRTLGWGGYVYGKQSFCGTSL